MKKILPFLCILMLSGCFAETSLSPLKAERKSPMTNPWESVGVLFLFSDHAFVYTTHSRKPYELTRRSLSDLGLSSVAFNHVRSSLVLDGVTNSIVQVDAPIGVDAKRPPSNDQLQKIMQRYQLTGLLVFSEALRERMASGSEKVIDLQGVSIIENRVLGVLDRASAYAVFKADLYASGTSEPVASAASFAEQEFSTSDIDKTTRSEGKYLPPFIVPEVLDAIDDILDEIR